MTSDANPGPAPAAQWDPDQYLAFAGHRERPGLELIARIPDTWPGTIVDLGSGTGSLTEMLRRRWPQARVIGVDSSPEMVARARSDHPEIEWLLADIAGWEPDGPVDMIFSNAALHWLDDHHRLFPRLESYLSGRGLLAVQMPDNWSEPTHTVPARILDEDDWPAHAVTALMRNRLSTPDDYRAWLQPAAVDMWRTTYFQTLTGPDPIWSWVTGSVLRPVLEALDERDAMRFEGMCKAAYSEAYPPVDGVTLLPFSRFFMIART